MHIKTAAPKLLNPCSLAAKTDNLKACVVAGLVFIANRQWIQLTIICSFELLVSSQNMIWLAFRACRICHCERKKKIYDTKSVKMIAKETSVRCRNCQFDRYIITSA